MTFVPHRSCPLAPRTAWWKRLASALTLGAYLPPSPPRCECMLCYYDREQMQELYDRIRGELGE